MAKSLIPVAFHGATLQAVVLDGVPHVSVRSICDALGVDFKAQRHRIKRHPVLSQGGVITTTPSPGGDQQTLLLPLDKLNGWLFGVSAARVRPELRERLIQYQRECFDVLAAHFGTKPAALPAPALPPEPPLRLQVVSMFTIATEISAQLFANPAARRLLVETAGAGSKPRITALPDDVRVTSWADIAADIRAGRCPPELLPTLREAAALGLFFSPACREPQGPGRAVADALREAADQLSLADLCAIAVAASGQLWALAAKDKPGAGAAAVLKAVPKPNNPHSTTPKRLSNEKMCPK